MQILTEFILPITVAFLAGFSGSVIAPWANWGVERRRLRYQRRCKLVDDWDNMMQEYSSDPSQDLFIFLERRKEFNSLRPLLPRDLREDLEKLRPPLVYHPGPYAETPPTGGMYGIPSRSRLADRIIDEIGRLRKKWGVN